MATTLRFHLDESVTTEIAEPLRVRGIDCSTTPDRGMIGASDPEQFAFAKAEGRVLVTNDRDFLDISKGDYDHPGIVIWKKQRPFSDFATDLLTLCDERGPEEMRSVILWFG